MGDDYEAFVKQKLRRSPPTGLAQVPELHERLFPFQRALVGWALKRGRAAIFADTGLGKTVQQLEWARHVAEHTGEQVLILAPLAVAAQTVREGKEIDLGVTLCRDAVDMREGVNITNYDRLHRFSRHGLGGIVLDESSIIKHHDAKTLGLLMEFSRDIPFRLAATATPAPNDFTELGTHAEWLGICTRQEMLSEFFVHDGGSTQDWRLKGHARGEFWKWVASWGALLRRPSDLGFDDTGYDLPPLDVEQHTIAADMATAHRAGMLFVHEASSLTERRAAKRASIEDRVAACAAVVQGEPDERWIVWCDLNSEQDALEAAFGDECISIYGSLDADEKESRLNRFIAGEGRILLGKVSIFGFGINLQSVCRMAFVGVTDSWESYYQAVRRCWRFGQKRPVKVHLFASEAEGAVAKNLARKEADAKTLAEQLSQETRAAVEAEVRGSERESNPYEPIRPMEVPSWLRAS